MEDARWIAYGMADLISKPAWIYTIGSTPEFWLISSSQNDPLLGPQFHPPRVVNWRPHMSMPTGSPDLILVCTQIEVLGPASYPASHWPYPGWASHA